MQLNTEAAPEPVRPYTPNFVLVPDAPEVQPETTSEIAARQAQGPTLEIDGAEVAAPSPEASQRPSYEAEPEIKTPDPGRLAGIIAAARERLAALGERLDAAFGRIRDQVLGPKPEASHAMSRAPESGPENARQAAAERQAKADNAPPPPRVDEDRAREIQRQIEAGRKAGTYDRDRMRDLAREHHELRGAAPNIAPAPKPTTAASEPSEEAKAELQKTLNPYRRDSGPKRGMGM